MLQQTNFFWKPPLIWTLKMSSLLSHLTTFLKQGKTVPSVPGPGKSESSKLSKNWLKAISAHCKSYTIYIEYTPPPLLGDCYTDISYSVYIRQDTNY